MQDIVSQKENRDLARKKLQDSFDSLLSYNGPGHLEVNTKILKRGQREITIQCFRTHRYVVDMDPAVSGKEVK